MSTDWNRAACLHPSVRPQDMSPVDGAGRLDEAKARRVAAALCGQCPIREACLNAALEARAQGPRPSGYGPQELIQAGMWWPVERAKDPTPIDLFITDRVTATDEKAAAA